MTHPALVEPRHTPRADTSTVPPPVPWSLLGVLVIAALCVSVSLNVALWRQSSQIVSQREQLAAQIEAVPKLRQKAQALLALVRDVALFSEQHPDVLPVLTKYGYSVAGTPNK